MDQAPKLRIGELSYRVGVRAGLLANYRFAPIARALKGLARRRPLVLAGAGATPELGAELDVACLNDDPVIAAEGSSRQFVTERGSAASANGRMRG